MANYEPDKVMFDQVKEGIKKLTDILTTWQQKESAMHSMAEVQAKASGAPPEHMDAHVYMHKKAIKKAMVDQAKQSEQAGGGPGVPGVPSGQNDPGGQTSTVVPGPQGSQGITPTAPPTGPETGGRGGPGMVARMSPTLPMAGHTQNTGANGWEGLMKPTPYPGVAQSQTGAPTSFTGQTTAAQHAMPGMPTSPVPEGFTGPGTMRPSPSQTNTLPSAQPPLTRPMR